MKSQDHQEEQKIREIVSKELTQYVDSIKTDNLVVNCFEKGKKEKSYDSTHIWMRLALL